MEYAGAEQLMHVGIQQLSRQRGSGRCSVGGLEAGAVASILDHHVAGGVRFDDVWLGDAGQGVKHPGHATHVLCFVAHVDLVAQECTQFVDELERAVPRERRPQPLGHAHRAPQQPQVGLHLGMDAGARDLDDHVASVMHARRVDLGD